MKTTEKTTRICPLCHAEYHGVPAISRTDNRTPICPDCGIRQSLAVLNVPTDEQKKIIDIIHSSRRS
ncbi:MAG: hypothetical protein NC177_07505 [Ruminococcus flavefaciens]|nr:hypothetical protein [Ruminococcus flavefaciens]